MIVLSINVRNSGNVLNKTLIINAQLNFVICFSNGLFSCESNTSS